MEYSTQKQKTQSEWNWEVHARLSTNPDKSSVEIMKLKIEEVEKIISYFVGLQEKIRMVIFFFKFIDMSLL